MKMINVVGKLEDCEDILKDLILSSKVELVSAISQIENLNFVFNFDDSHIEQTIDLNYILPFNKDDDFQEISEKAEWLMEIESICPEDLHKDWSITDFKNRVRDLYSETKSLIDNIQDIRREISENQVIYEKISNLKGHDIPFEKLIKMEHFIHKIGKVDLVNYNRLQKNYDNNPAVVKKLSKSDNWVTFSIIYPIVFSEEIERLLNSLNFDELEIPNNLISDAASTIENLEYKISFLKEELAEREEMLKNRSEHCETNFAQIGKGLKLYEKIELAKKELARSSKFFFLSAWVATEDIPEVEKIFNKYDNILISSNENVKNPPTKLRNQWIFKPFEMLINMYGTPNYKEIDPTPFVALTYLLTYGIMFGDLGQGFVIMLAGLILSKTNKIFGGLLARIGISSMFFGLMYGSVFGNEEILPALLIRPFEEVNTMLVSTIFLGIVILLFAYIIGVVNKFRAGDLENGLFGSTGLAGLIFYSTALLLAGKILLNINTIPSTLAVVILIVTTLAMVFKLPLSNLITKNRPLAGSDPSGYFLESSFGILETIISMFSGTVSFIRVGAFALVHVGMFMAFTTIGDMIGTSTGGIIMAIIGNAVVIVLEGLIVFIQALRLQYYELFSKYYSGEGTAFEPLCIEK